MTIGQRQAEDLLYRKALLGKQGHASLGWEKAMWTQQKRRPQKSIKA